ncbi:hypothetical protein KTE29_29820 [Burkholderia multivorans]|uniref:hypothetical protein n=1 Tax=Burkholderia cepacia complex TaxID=87882 RepID=UPI001041785C|nr:MULTISPECIES: hypothetical protein [Burkholderia cepacia complex]MBU9205995.1 hypothetical protein [Burkholderia multivorans]MBU9451961.1 hypothetical protein [Burkholderia multivorans]MBU9486664.1 hypothetical protein [Burkholderia multivorans]MBU9492773.1 hypothetical protein [Burkholderia multivorans]MBU9522457.1 hypothetical protein [Burkholderia multivorans]
MHTLGIRSRLSERHSWVLASVLQQHDEDGLPRRLLHAREPLHPSGLQSIPDAAAAPCLPSKTAGKSRRFRCWTRR